VVYSPHDSNNYPFKQYKIIMRYACNMSINVTGIILKTTKEVG